jgi:hypothetical protein
MTWARKNRQGYGAATGPHAAESKGRTPGEDRGGGGKASYEGNAFFTIFTVILFFLNSAKFVNHIE